MDPKKHPAWLAFDAEPRPGIQPRTAEQLAARERGLREMREGKLLDIDLDAEIAKLRSTR